MENKQVLSKEERIKNEVERINRLLKNVDDKKRKAVDSLVNNAAFMTVTLEDLQDEINRNGTTEQYKNGANQYGIKKSAAVEVYNVMIKNHMNVIKQLNELVPKSEDTDDEFKSFMMRK